MGEADLSHYPSITFSSSVHALSTILEKIEDMNVPYLEIAKISSFRAHIDSEPKISGSLGRVLLKVTFSRDEDVQRLKEDVALDMSVRAAVAYMNPERYNVVEANFSII